LYPALWEEYGMVVAEAQAMGVPILTSRRVGAAEGLPALYAPWLSDAPSADAFAERALELIVDPAAGGRLAAAGLESIARFSDARYGALSAATILETERD
jgi:UDP-glucose:(heptosyl)LPS alpha-1,3-glucosyltransferase